MEWGQNPSGPVLALFAMLHRNKDHSFRQKGPVWLVLLVGIIMGQAGISIPGRHAAAFVHPAVIREMQRLECVLIANRSPINEAAVTGLYKLDLFRRKQPAKFGDTLRGDIWTFTDNYIPRQFYGGKH
ncbi:MAG: hypothetical protein WA303_16740, partial [Bradyrhizobium sp.]